MILTPTTLIWMMPLHYDSDDHRRISKGEIPHEEDPKAFMLSLTEEKIPVIVL